MKLVDSTSYSMPYSSDAEERLIGSVMADPDVLRDFESVEKLRPDHFYLPRHEAIWQVLIDMDFEGDFIDVASVVERLRVTKSDSDSNLLTEVGGPAYLLGLREAAVPFDAPTDARHIFDHAMRRQIIHGAREALSDALAAVTPVDEVVAKLDAHVTGIVRDPLSVTTDTEAYEATMARLKGTAKIKTGFHALDARFGGWPVGDLATVAARSTTGKSSFAYQAAISLTNRLKMPVGILSPDQEKGEIFSVLTARLSGVSSDRIELGEASSAERKRYGEAAGYVRKVIAPRLIIRDGFLGHTTVEREYNRLVRKGCGAVIVDTLQAIDEGRDPKRTQIDNTCRVLKGLARQYRNVTIAVSQIKQEVSYRPEAKGGRRPLDYDCSESKNIYDLSNTMLFLYRPWIDNSFEDEHVVEVRVAKQKTGKKNAYAELYFQPELQMFKNYDGSVPGLQIEEEPFK